MTPRNRRWAVRVPLQIFFNQYLGDRRVRAITGDVSGTGLQACVVGRAWPAQRTGDIGIELELPGTGEVIWARGRICRASCDAWVRTTGIYFVSMAARHARLVHDFCAERRRQSLAAFLPRIRDPHA